MKPMSDLAAHLDAADESLLVYVDDDGHLRVPAARRMVRFAEALLHGTVTPSQLERDWPEWYDLTEAFVAASGVKELAAAAQPSTLGMGNGDALTAADRRFLEQLMVWLETCAAARDQGCDC